MRLKDEFEHTIEIERSRFICYLKKVSNEEQARDYIKNIVKMHPNATHHCTAFICGNNDEIQRCNDDGEPSGTAGVPMLQALKNTDIHDVVAVVVRYFGGIKLGAGGLIRAYSKSVSEAVLLADKVEPVKVKVYQLDFSYDFIGKIDYLLKNRCTVLEKEYQEQVRYLFYTTETEILEEIKECTSGQYLPIYKEEQIIEVAIQ